MNINFQSIPNDNDDFRSMNDTIQDYTDENNLNDIGHKERRVDMDDYSYSNPLLSDITNPNDYCINRSLEFVSDTSCRRFKGMDSFTAYSNILENARKLKARGNVLRDLRAHRMPKPRNNN